RSAAAHRPRGTGRQIGDAEPPRAVPPHGGASGVERDRAADLRGAPRRGDTGGAAASLSARRGGGGASRSRGAAHQRSAGAAALGQELPVEGRGALPRDWRGAGEATEPTIAP